MRAEIASFESVKRKRQLIFLSHPHLSLHTTTMALTLSPPPRHRHRLLIALLTALIPLVLSHGGSHDEDSADDGDQNAHNLRSKGLILVKIWCLFIAFGSTFIAGVSPYFLRWNDTFLTLGTQFAGGVFLGTALMHFLSDSAETFGDLTTKEYPFAFMLCTAGYFATMLADIAVSYVYGRGSSGAALHHHSADNPAKDAETGVEAEIATDEEERKSNKRRSMGESILLIIALCFHSVFEGIAIGVAENKAGAWRALWTVCLHKLFAAVAMGIALLRMIPERPLLTTIAYSFAFAVSTPIGVAIGILIDATSEGRVADWIYAVSMGFACGVFVYVAVNHLLGNRLLAGKEKDPTLEQKRVLLDRPAFNFLAGALGAATIGVVMIWD